MDTRPSPRTTAHPFGAEGHQLQDVAPGLSAGVGLRIDPGDEVRDQISAAQRVGVVFNPHSKKNRRRPERFVTLQRLVGDVGEVRRTSHVDEIDQVAEDFLDAGIGIWVADGGDGAFHWLMNAAERAIRRRGRGEAMPLLMPTRSGTVDFLAVKARLSGAAEDLLASLIASARRGEAPDVLWIDSLRVRGEPVEVGAAGFDRLGFATALAGVGQQFFCRFYDNGDPTPRGIVTVISKILGSAALSMPPLHLVPASAEARAYGAPVFAPHRLEVFVDGERMPFDTYRAVNVGSIDIDLAGVFRLFPHAAEPGVMHAILGDPGFFDVLGLLPRMAAGRGLQGKSMVDRRAQTLQLRACGDTVIDPVIDGELFYGLRNADVALGPSIGIARPPGKFVAARSDR